MMNPEKQQYSILIDTIGSLLQQGRQQAAQSVNTILVQTYWTIGQHIVEFEQDGKHYTSTAASAVRIVKSLNLPINIFIISLLILLAIFIGYKVKKRHESKHSNTDTK